MRRFLWAMVGAGLCVGCPEEYLPPEHPTTPDPSVALYVTSELDKAVRIQRLRSDVTLDCEHVSLLPGRMAAHELDPALFETGWKEQLGKGKRVAVPRRAGAACDLVRLELDGGKVFVTTVNASEAETITLTAEGFGGGYYVWPELARGHDASLERCSVAQPAPVRWSEPVPIGRELRIEAIDRDGACAKLQLKNGFVWEVCTGEADLPLAAGDAIDVALSAPKVGVVERATIRIDRHARPNDDSKLRIWLGEGPVTHEGNDLSQPRISVSRDDRCVVRTAECGMVTLPARLDVSLAQRSMQLRSGEHARLAHEPGSLELAIGQLELVPIRAAACGDVAARPSFVAIDRRRVREVRVAAEN